MLNELDTTLRDATGLPVVLKSSNLFFGIVDV